MCGAYQKPQTQSGFVIGQTNFRNFYSSRAFFTISPKNNLVLQYRHNCEGKNFFLFTECIRIPFVQSSICLLDANQTLTLQCHKPPYEKPHKYFKHDYEDQTGLVNVNRYHLIQRQLHKTPLAIILVSFGYNNLYFSS